MPVSRPGAIRRTTDSRRGHDYPGHLKGSNLVHVKSINQSVVLSAIRHFGPISRTELAELTELTSATITNVTSQLAELDLIHESGSAASHGGRKRVLLKLNDDAYWVIGAEISRQHTSALLVNLTGRIIRSEHEEIERSEGPAKTIERLVGMIRRLLAHAAQRGKRVIGVGIGVPGPVNTQEGIVISPPNFPGWHWIPLRDMVAEAVGLPVFIDDDAKTSALGEAWFGAGRDVDSLVYLSIGTGIGAGVIVDGRLYRGTHELAGEIGHMTLDIDGPRCECSNVGCLEVLASVPALIQAAEEELDRGVPSALARVRADRTLLIEDICREALANDPVAVRVLQRASRYLGAAVINTVNLYDPEMIILGGKLVRAYNQLVDDVRHQVRERAFSFAADKVTIVPAMLQADASSVGGATLVLEHLFADPAQCLAMA